MYNKDKLNILLNDLMSYIAFNEEYVTDTAILYDLLKSRTEYVVNEIKKLYKL